SASAKVICFIGKLGGWGRGILPNQKVFFRVSLTIEEETPILSMAHPIQEPALIKSRASRPVKIS
ncbi:hypothetical protein AO268_16560, partial [Pseudomonas sp. ICMP 8385]